MLRHRLSLEEFQALLEKAPEGVRLELLDGEVYEMAPIGSGHASLVTYLAKQLERLYGDQALVYVQNSLRLSQHCLPQPDLALPIPRDDRGLAGGNGDPGGVPRTPGKPLPPPSAPGTRGGGGPASPRPPCPALGSP